MKELLPGKKTYILAGLLVVLGVLYAFELLPEEVFLGVFSLLTGGGLAALRKGVTQ